MKIAIISDTHDNIPNIEKLLSFLKKEGIKTIIHCGDVCNIEVIKKLEENFKSKIYLTLGNADLREKIKQEIKNIKLFEDYGEIDIESLKIAFCHKPILAEKISQEKKYDFIFHGHTHKPWLKKNGNCIIANPGNLAGVVFKPTFAILDTETRKLSLKILEKI
ncbi:hypothetical protein AMJ49_02150 [Parcubacteria bacterium DG_74_2]|nr:MAG: hypothetical protein AMJ49_02150 [Parcubacteria bacterium DG_74_2]